METEGSYRPRSKKSITLWHELLRKWFLESNFCHCFERFCTLKFSGENRYFSRNYVWNLIFSKRLISEQCFVSNNFVSDGIWLKRYKKKATWSSFCKDTQKWSKKWFFDPQSDSSDFWGSNSHFLVTVDSICRKRGERLFFVSFGFGSDNWFVLSGPVAALPFHNLRLSKWPWSTMLGKTGVEFKGGSRHDRNRHEWHWHNRRTLLSFCVPVCFWPWNTNESPIREWTANPVWTPPSKRKTKCGCCWQNVICHFGRLIRISEREFRFK